MYQHFKLCIKKILVHKYFFSFLIKIWLKRRGFDYFVISSQEGVHFD